MTTLNSRLQLALLNRKKGRNLLEKGFTLVELMIVIVIVGILSAVALPNFLNQTSKAKATECTTKIGSILSALGAEAQDNATDAYNTASDTIADDTSSLCTLTLGAQPVAPDITFTLTASGDGELAGKFVADSCIDYATGKKDIESAKVAADLTAADCAA